jgi:hypothetical protein
LRGALRGVEILLAQQPMACSDGGTPLHQADFRIQEALPPVTTVSVAITENCLAQHEELRMLIAAAHGVYEANRADEICS